MPREAGRIEKDNQERSRWYRLFVAEFQNQNEAETFCHSLSVQLLRCNVVSSDSSDFDQLRAEKPKQVIDETGDSNKSVLLEEASTNMKRNEITPEHQFDKADTTGLEKATD